MSTYTVHVHPYSRSAYIILVEYKRAPSRGSESDPLRDQKGINDTLSMTRCTQIDQPFSNGILHLHSNDTLYPV